MIPAIFLALVVTMAAVVVSLCVRYLNGVWGAQALEHPTQAVRSVCVTLCQRPWLPKGQELLYRIGWQNTASRAVADKPGLVPSGRDLHIA